jgi:undecaprenyl-diphosphatase
MNQDILLALHGFFDETPILVLCAIFFAKWLPYCLGLAALFYAYKKHTLRGLARSIFFVFSPTLVAWLTATTVKFLFPAMRPFVALNFTPLVSGENPFASFPSTHATFFAALAVTIFLQDKKVGRWFLLGAFLVGFGRIAVGVHYPGDVLAGFLLGGTIALIAHYIILKIGKRG